MKRTILSMSIAALAAPALAHPGSVQVHEALGSVGHLMMMVMPYVIVLALVGVTAYALLRRKG